MNNFSFNSKKILFIFIVRRIYNNEKKYFKLIY